MINKLNKNPLTLNFLFKNDLKNIAYIYKNKLLKHHWKPTHFCTTFN